MSRFCRLWLLLNDELLSTIFSSSSISSACRSACRAGKRGGGGPQGEGEGACESTLTLGAHTGNSIPPSPTRTRTHTRHTCMKALTATETDSGFLHSGSAVLTTCNVCDGGVASGRWRSGQSTQHTQHAVHPAKQKPEQQPIISPCQPPTAPRPPHLVDELAAVLVVGLQHAQPQLVLRPLHDVAGLCGGVAAVGEGR